LRAGWNSNPREDGMRGSNVFKTVETNPKQFAHYFGLTVEVIARMESYSLFCWNDRSFIAETADLQQAAMLAA
jgi:hypothetical protein